LEKVRQRKSYRFWHMEWWRQDSERIKWAATVGVIAVLLAGGMYVDARRHGNDPAQVTAGTNHDQEPDAALAETEGNASQSPSMAAEQPAQPIGDPAADSPALEAPAQETGAAVEEPEPSLPVLASALTFTSPVAEGDGGALLRGYGYSWDPTTEDYRFHRGLDLALYEGGPVYAGAAGTVTRAEEDAYWGGIVTIEHAPGCYSIYKGLSAEVSVGDSVHAGTLIGHQLSCPAELAEDSHVHVEAEINGASVNPTDFL